MLKAVQKGGRDGAGKVGVDNDAVKVADNQQGRIFQGVPVTQQLIIGGRKILALKTTRKGGGCTL